MSINDYVICNCETIPFRLTTQLPEFSFPLTDELEEETSHNLCQLVFTTHALKISSQDASSIFVKRLIRQLYINRSSFPIEETLPEYPYKQTRNIIEEILNKVMIPKEPDSIFAEMVKLTPKLISEKKMKWVGMGRLIKGT